MFKRTINYFSQLRITVCQITFVCSDYFFFSHSLLKDESIFRDDSKKVLTYFTQNCKCMRKTTWVEISLNTVKQLYHTLLSIEMETLQVIWLLNASLDVREDYPPWVWGPWPSQRVWHWGWCSPPRLLYPPHTPWCCKNNGQYKYIL